MGNALAERSVILIVEDDFFLRMDAVDILSHAGYAAIEAGDADEAIAILETRPDILVIFTDVQMPGSMDGLQLARFVRNRWPPIKIVGTSGLADLGEKDLPEGGCFVSKPYQAAEIVRAVGEVLEARQ